MSRHEADGPPFIQKSLPLLSESERQAVMEMLQTEYIHLLPLVQLGLANAATTTADPALSQKSGGDQ
jgi:hypothetical protein